MVPNYELPTTKTLPMPSLITNSSPLIEQARSSHTAFIDQPHHLHSDGNHLA